MQNSFFVCECFFTRNYFIPGINRHVVYNGKDDEFVSKNKEWILQQSNYSTVEILEILHAEYSRRKTIGFNTRKTIEQVASLYKPLHRDIYYLKEVFLEESFLKLVKYCQSPKSNCEGATAIMEKCPADNVYRIKIFKNEFCRRFVEELENFEASECLKNRPNTMNHYGILMNEIGMDKHFLNIFRSEYIQPIARLLYPNWVINSLDSHKAFTVKYSDNKDVDLPEHYDNAEVTVNVCLGKEFEDGSLYFKSMRQISSSFVSSEIKHQIGYGIFHRGQHIHAAMPISSGERCNLIMWMRSSEKRNKLCPMCDKPPKLVPQIEVGDGFTTMEMCSIA